MSLKKIAFLFFCICVVSCQQPSSSQTQNSDQPVLSPESFALKNIKEGDIIFQKSQSTQAAAIREATGSEWSHVGILVKDKNIWYVAEAIQPLQATELQKWINRGKNHEYRVFRNPLLKESQIPTMYSILRKYRGEDYDIYFEWSDDRIYCSELVYKVFEKLTGTGVGKLQKMKELNLNGPYVKELIKRRLTDLGKTLNPEEDIVTPIAQMQDKSLTEVLSR